MNKLKELLEKWHQVEPEWAKHAIALIPDDDDYTKGAWAHNGSFVIVPLIKAIDSHGWIWSLDRVKTIDGDLVYVAKVKPGDNAFNNSGCTEVSSLLNAYLSALTASSAEEIK